MKQRVEPKDIMRMKARLGGSERGRGKSTGCERWGERDRNWEKAQLRIEDKVLPGSKKFKLLENSSVDS